MKYQTKISKIFNKAFTVISLPVLLPLIAICWLAERLVDCGERFQTVMWRITSTNYPDKNEAFEKMYKYHSLSFIFAWWSWLAGSILLILAEVVGSRTGVFIIVGLTLTGFILAGFFVWKRDKIHNSFPDLPNLSASGF